MRNLKKLLALVLAMVMAFSLMLSASATDYEDYPDKDQITEEFQEAVNVKNADFETTLNMAARRDVVADLLFETAVLVPTVTYTPALSYSDKTSLTSQYKNPTLGQKTFGLFCDKKWVEVDEWGTPGYYWVKNGEHSTRDYSDGTSTLRYDTDFMPIYDGKLGTKNANVVATISPKPSQEYYDAGVHECDVAEDLGIATSHNFTLYVNRDTPITTAYNVVAIDTVTRVGGQGRETKFWYKVTSRWFKDEISVCTMVDTYLATVTNVTERVLDPAGHVIVPAYLYLDVYDGQAQGPSNKDDGYEPTSATDTVTRNTSEHRASKSTANWEYVKGDKVLVRGYTDYTQNDANEPVGNTAVENASGLNHLYNNTTEAANRAAFETNRLEPAGASYAGDEDLSVLKKTEPVLGKQTVTYWNQGKHTVDGKDYNDQMTLFLDVAGTTTNTTFAWYFDGRGNLIGIDYVPDTVNYGVITSIWSSFGQGSADTDGTAKTYATVLYADGTEATVVIDRFLVSQGSTIGTNGHVAPTTSAATEMKEGAGTAELIPVYDYNGGANDPLTMAGSARTGTPKNAAVAGYLHVAPVASINTAQDKNSDPNYGIIKGNLFKFEASADGALTAIEVGGRDTTGNANDGKYVGHYNLLNDNNGAANTTGKLYKNLAYISIDGGASKIAWLDSDTRIMLNNGAGTLAAQKVTCYTMSTLPGDITIAANSEIDWADTDGDGRAEYVYVTGECTGTVTYGLFYYNGGAAQWNGVEKMGTMFGWLNGEATTITFDDETEFNIVKNSQSYAAHLFALRLSGGVVSNILGTNSGTTPNTNHKEWLFTKETDQASNGAIPIDTGVMLSTVLNTNKDGILTVSNTDSFEVGSANSANGNPYTGNTQGIYIDDVAPNGTTQSVSYDAATKTVIVWTDDGTTDGIMQASEIDATYVLILKFN